ncbi:hypothetical protein HHE02_10280 [Helicobacter heilmannii]|uniref:Uncharacterized protein n=1 Tax=Helicobacter heilmannii TaxID=35817 RepID=A0A0K2XMI0_HELHE|nr:hypothetical protein HHE02_10280 [Helicobacter heilmannii]CRI35216.1 hypothetical protein HHE01_02140 [Helicobacter heilmannii]
MRLGKLCTHLLLPFKGGNLLFWCSDLRLNLGEGAVLMCFSPLRVEGGF